jgi:hypothetical protein
VDGASRRSRTVGPPLSRRSRHSAQVAVEHRHCRRSAIDHQAQLCVDGARFLLILTADVVGYSRLAANLCPSGLNL